MGRISKKGAFSLALKGRHIPAQGNVKSDIINQGTNELAFGPNYSWHRFNSPGIASIAYRGIDKI